MPLEQVFTVIDETTRAPARGLPSRVLSLGTAVPMTNHTVLVARDGTERPIENCGAPIRGADGAVAGVVLCFRDVSERTRAESELKAAKEAADDANRAKDRFLAVLSHELRTPLTPVLLAVTDLLEAGGETPPRPTLEMIQRNIQLEARLIDDLLDLARVGRGELRLDLAVTDAHEGLRRAAEMFQAEARAAGVEIRLDLNAAASRVRADGVRLMQVLWNLIGNAVKYAPGGTLTVRTWNTPADSGPAATSLVIEFEDDGVGIEPALLARVFEPFRQGDTTARRRGLGLGLAISKRVIDAHGGRIVAESRGIGQGSTFRVTLPALDDQPALVAESPGDASWHAPSGLSVLLVEDNADALRFLERILSRRGYTVRTASTLAAASAALGRGPFDLLISDIELPDGTGLELIGPARRAGVLAGIALSGFGTDEDVRESLAAGFSAHLNKPVTVATLATALAAALAAAGRDADGVHPAEAADPNSAGPSRA
jgi:signal transduction histidine kinase/CheY-like chemotaxis protein